MKMLPCLVLLLLACTERGPKTSFDGNAALGYVREQMAFGPRIPGTEGHRRTGDWIVAQMKTRADTVIEQTWVHVTARGDSLRMRNVLARIRPGMPQRVLYLAHWDTRPVSDEAADAAQRAIPVPGANDGGSGVALLMAVADALKSTPPIYGVDLLFVDGEDYGDFGPPPVDVLIGSTYFAANPPSADYRPLFGVLWDMIGDRELQIMQEGHSVRGAPEVVQRVWAMAAELGYQRTFLPRGGYEILDDHVPLLRAGYRVIDVIDLDYCCHHKPTDTIDKVSVQSLQTVGDVAVALLTR